MLTAPRRLKRRLFSSALADSVKTLSCAEYERNAPDTRKSNYRIDNSADYGHRSAAYPRDEVEIKNTYATPVESADNSENKSYSVYYHHHVLAFPSERDNSRTTDHLISNSDGKALAPPRDFARF